MFKKALIIGMIVVVSGWMFTSVVQAASPPAQGEGREYVIQADDWLRKMAEKYLGDATLWSWIVEATNARATVNPRLDYIEKMDEGFTPYARYSLRQLDHSPEIE